MDSLVENKCRICKANCGDLPECHNCWEIYSRLQGLPKELIRKLIKEADSNWVITIRRKKNQ